MGLGRKSLCKAPVTSVVKGLIYAGFKRVLVSWPEVCTQLTPHFRDLRFSHGGVIALHSSAFKRQARTLEQRGQS